MALKKLARVTSAFTVVEYLKDALMNPNLPKKMQKEAYALFHQRNPMDANDSEYSFEGSPSKESLDFARTALMKDNLGRSIIEYDGKKYPLITHKTTDFYGQRLAFYGNREVLILDPKTSTKLEKHYKLILGIVEVLSLKNPKKIIKLVFQYVQKVIFPNQSVENV